MRPYGFPEELVQEMVGELLDVYGGNDGWVFIEEASYTLLLETILETIKDREREKDKSSQDDAEVADEAEASAIGPSDGVSFPICSNTEALDAVSQTNQSLYATSQTNETLGTGSVTHESDGRYCLPPATHSGVDETFGNSLAQSSPHLICSQLPVDSLPTRRRRSYHGWISSDDEKDLVHLTPAPLQFSLAKLLSTPGRKGKRKTRWDVRPQDG